MSKQRQTKSAQWRRRQEADIHVRSARAEGYRSRAAYKLLEIDKSYTILRRGLSVADLGAAPGSWSQVAAKKVGNQGQVLAVDKLPMTPLPEVEFTQGDFCQHAVQQQLLEKGKVDAVICDMAPDLTGIAVRDQANAYDLFQTVAVFCHAALKQHGDLLIKIFAGETSAQCRALIQPVFKQIKTIHPRATRKASRECYLLARDFLIDGERGSS